MANIRMDMTKEAILFRIERDRVYTRNFLRHKGGDVRLVIFKEHGFVVAEDHELHLAP